MRIAKYEIFIDNTAISHPLKEFWHISKRF